MRAGILKETYPELVRLTDSMPVKVWSILLVLGASLLPALVGSYALSFWTTIVITSIGVVGLN